MSLFGGLYVGASGLQTSQNALNTVAHNMTNVDTEGYTRQQIQLATRTYNTISKTSSANAYQQVGLGVSYEQVKQVRDYFLDKAYRKELGREGFYNVSCDAIEEVEEIFQELDGEAFANSLDNLWQSVQELDKDPSNSVNQGVLVQRCAEFVTRSQAVWKNLCDYQDDLNYDVKKKINEINDLGKQLVKLNEQILKIESGQVEHANDLKDERNSLIDKLSEYANISVKSDIDGNYIVQIEGIDFVSAGSYKEMEVYEDPVTGFYTPYWKSLAKYDTDGSLQSIKGAHVFNMEQEISTDMNTDIGSVKSLLLARGDHRANHEDLDPSKYDDIKDSVVMNVMAEFDKLIHDVTTSINDVLKDAAESATTANPKSTYLRDPKTVDGSNPYGKPYEMFVLSADADGYTTPNILINEDIKQAPSLLGFIRPDGKVDQDATAALKKVFTDEVHTLNPDVKTTTNLTNYYNNLISQVSNTGYIMRGISANQTITVTNLASSREEVVGVSTDEELGNMIMFQNAFNASSRYINALSEMIEHLVTTLGR